MRELSRAVLDLDLEAEAERLSRALRGAVQGLRRRGLVVAVSGGIDSACVAAIGARALGKDHVHALLVRERDWSRESVRLGTSVCDALGIGRTVEDIAPILVAAGCYRHREEAVRSVFPGFEPSMRWKMVLASDRLQAGRLSFWQVVVEAPGGETRAFRLTPAAYLRILAATNFKQRTRKMLEYFHADRLNYAVGGTPNRLEYDQGFFVKLGDGAADVKPIAPPYKTQGYALAGHLGVPEEVLRREPTTDTYSLSQSQEEFYFSVDYRRLDLLMWAKDHGIAPELAAPEVGMTPQHVRHVYEDIDAKRRGAECLHAPPLLLEELDGRS